jgi:tetratricopeptide (TPR) repeat protein
MKNIRLFVAAVLILFAFGNNSYLAQENPDALKQAALAHMKAGRYGEAINLLNKYISARPRIAEGYNLRGQCYEARSQYKYAVIDYRRARKLEPKNQEVLKNLARVTSVWYRILKKNIVGYKRDIKINPGNPYNYLEIGKAYRWMEEWELAEEWYDKYLALDPNASPDEIIRYSEILAANKHIKKGQIILKKWVDKYPSDWRLWSRYGYFSLWLGKYKIAKKAFERALSFKPFFQEAKDGLDIANRHAYVTELGPSDVREYPIDRYYRILRKNPNDDKVRFLLVDELIKAKRIEEAYQQLLILGTKYEGDPRYEKKWNYVVNYRNKVYSQKIDVFKTKFDKNPKDKKAAYNLAKYYTYKEKYDSAVAVYEHYLNEVPDEKDPQFLFDYARAASWNREFDKAIKIMDKLLEKYPDNLDYQLFRAQLSIWTNQTLDVANKYLTNVLKKRPNNVDALIAMGSYLLIKRDFDGAKKMADRAEKINASDPEIEKLRSNIEFQEMRAKEEKLYKILEQGRQLAMKDSCEEALPYYREYLDKAEPNDLILKEYGDVEFCAKDYEGAKRSYETVLSHGYMYEAALQHAKLAYAMGDSIEALKEFRELTKREPDEFDPILYLADTYAKVDKPDSARMIYNTLLNKWDLDSTEISMVKMRLGWLPVTGLEGFLETFPSSIGFSPAASYYGDNLGFRFYRAGGRLDLGLISYFSAGVSFTKTFVMQTDVNHNILNRRDFTSFKGHLFVNVHNIFSAGIGYGSNNSGINDVETELEAFARYEKKDTFSVVTNYTKSDADLILYSPNLIDVRLMASLLHIGGYYRFKSTLTFSGYYNYITVSDGNAGNNIQLRVGKEFYPNLMAGYEYYYANFRFEDPHYYTPIAFVSHSLWGEYYVIKNDEMELKTSAKAGYVPSNKFILLEGKAEFNYKITKKLSVAAAVSMGSTTRENESYKYNAAEFSAYWSIY